MSTRDQGVYERLLEDVLQNGTLTDDRTGVGTRSVFGRQISFDLTDGTLPALTTKKLHFKSIIHELLWMLRGETNIGPLNDVGVSIWNEWADGSGELGPVYGKQWRRFQGAEFISETDHNGASIDLGEVDQIKNVEHAIRTDPHSRRHVVSAWNAVEVPQMALAPCHCLFQFYVNDGKLSCQLYQRSADIFLGVPFNIVSYALLTHMMAQTTGLKPGTFVHTFGDLHLYNNHVDQAQKQLLRSSEKHPFPTVKLKPDVPSVTDFIYSDIEIQGYSSYPPISAPVAV